MSLLFESLVCHVYLFHFFLFFSLRQKTFYDLILIFWNGRSLAMYLLYPLYFQILFWELCFQPYVLFYILSLKKQFHNQRKLTVKWNFYFSLTSSILKCVQHNTSYFSVITSHSEIYFLFFCLIFLMHYTYLHKNCNDSRF